MRAGNFLPEDISGEFNMTITGQTGYFKKVRRKIELPQTFALSFLPEGGKASDKQIRQNHRYNSVRQKRRDLKRFCQFADKDPRVSPAHGP